jgi:hypothetical protein
MKKLTYSGQVTASSDGDENTFLTMPAINLGIPIITNPIRSDGLTFYEHLTISVECSIDPIQATGHSVRFA